ncbi:site-specific DNA-methyltransferase [Lacisediminihabitans sp. FW035]
MARIHELLAQLRAAAPALASDIEREVDVLADRRAFGLNFERHTPEAVELPGRKVRSGDKVRVQPPRGELPTAAHRVLYRVGAIERDQQGVGRLATLAGLTNESDSVETSPSSRSADVDDLVVVAEFRDPIYPGLVSTGKVERGGDKPFHAVINAENFHALQALLFTHRGTVDAIYIDPPYNTGAKDWKYNNDYVESDDLYRHSKWLAFMERRILVAKELLKKDDAVLIVTIDEKEYLRLGLLLEQTLPEARIQMVSSVINPASSARKGEFGRSNEYLFFAYFGSAAPSPLELDPAWFGQTSGKRKNKIRWQELSRRGDNGRRSARPNLFYPVFVFADGSAISSVGEAIGSTDSIDSVTIPPGTVAIWPIRQDGSHGTWGRNPASLRSAISNGFVRIGGFTQRGMAIYHLAAGEQAKVLDGTFPVLGRRPDNSVIVDDSDYRTSLVPGTQWDVPSHDSSSFGSAMLSRILPGRRFPFPKSLYAVEDALRFFVADKPDATIVDFFSGSGTTAHGVMRLNKQDGGRRVSISVTNNEVGAADQARFANEGLRPGDPEWEQFGICDYITKPRIEAVVTGKTPAGEPIKGDYKFTDIFPMANGLEENVEFFTLTYEAPMRVQSNREFTRIAPFLWLRAGSRGRRIESHSEGWDVADSYCVLADLDQTDIFLEAVAKSPGVQVAFIVTDEDRLFQAVVRELPANVEPVRLYESYLRNFEIDAMRSVR